MTDNQAAIGREQLKRLSEIVARRRELADRYLELLADISGIVPPSEPSWARSNWQSYCVRLPERYDQQRVMQEMLEAGVATRRGIMCAHREPVYTGGESWSCGAGPADCGCSPGSCSRLQESEKAQDQSILLPLHHQMTEEDQDRVVHALRTACNA